MWATSGSTARADGALALVLALGAGQAALWTLGLPEGAGTLTFASRAVVLFGLQLAAVALLWNRRDRAVLWLVIGFAVAFLLAAWTWPPELSSDLFRYIWDGQVQAAGYSPYATAPADPALAHLRDGTIWPHINRPDAITVYPPGAQLAFLVLVRLGLGSVAGVKAAAGCAELVALVLLGLALHRRRIPVGRLALYAWSPLVVAEVWVSGHPDALVLPLVLGALLLAEAKRPAWAGGLIGAATLLKLYPALLLVALPKGRARRRAALVTGAVVAGGYLPYTFVSGAGVLGFLPDYVRTAEDFNLGLRGFAQQALALVLDQPRPFAMALCSAALLGALFFVSRQRDDDSFRKARSVALAFLLLLPTAVHPWYGLWLVPLLALHVSPAGVWLMGVLPLSYLKYGAPGGEMPAWVPVVEWLPAYLALLFAAWAGHRTPARAEAT